MKNLNQLMTRTSFIFLCLLIVDTADACYYKHNKPMEPTCFLVEQEALQGTNSKLVHNRHIKSGLSVFLQINGMDSFVSYYSNRLDFRLPDAFLSQPFFKGSLLPPPTKTHDKQNFHLISLFSYWIWQHITAAFYLFIRTKPNLTETDAALHQGVIETTGRRKNAPSRSSKNTDLTGKSNSARRRSEDASQLPKKRGHTSSGGDGRKPPSGADENSKIQDASIIENNEIDEFLTLIAETFRTKNYKRFLQWIYQHLSFLESDLSQNDVSRIRMKLSQYPMPQEHLTMLPSHLISPVVATSAAERTSEQSLNQKFRHSSTESLTFNGQFLRFNNLDEMANYLLLHEISANTLWEIIQKVVTDQLSQNRLSPTLSRLLWRAARGNREALLQLVRAHALIILNSPLQLFRTAQLYRQLSGHPQAITSGVNTSIWARCLSVLPDPHPVHRFSYTPPKKNSKKNKETLIAAWRAYIDVSKSEEVSHQLDNLRLHNIFPDHIELLERGIDGRGIDSAQVTIDSEPSSMLMHYLTRRFGSPHTPIKPHPVIYQAVVVRLITLNKQQDKKRFLALYHQLLRLLKIYCSGGNPELPEFMEYLDHALNPRVRNALIGTLAQHQETAIAASLLTKNIAGYDFNYIWKLYSHCSHCQGLHYLISLTCCNNSEEWHTGCICEPCYQSLNSKSRQQCLNTPNCNSMGTIFNLYEPLKTSLMTAANESLATDVPGVEELWLIEAPVLAKAGYSEIAVALIQVAMAQAGIEWHNTQSPNHDGMIIWLRQVFFDNPELLRTIMILLSDVTGMEWISQVIKSELENHSVEYQNPADLNPVP